MVASKLRETVQHHLSSGIQFRSSNISSEQVERIQQALKQHDAVLIAHYYTDPVIQELAEKTGGFVSDSLEMARFGAKHGASMLVIAGVRFMGESSKILSPEKRVFMLDIEATCSLDIGCPAKEFSQFCDQYPERTVVVYANTSAAVKARADWTVTSSCSVDVIEHLHAEGKSIIWAPDKYLGRYVQQKTGADMLLWDGSCIVHEEFKAQGIKELKHVYKDAAVLVHPESPEAVVEQADVVGSTSQLIQAANQLPNETFIVATEKGIFYKMQQLIGENKQLLEAPTSGHGATCRSCARCPWMAMNTIERLESVLQSEHKKNEIFVDASIREQAIQSLRRMLDFTS